MAQINIPTDFELQRALLANIITKNTDPDAGSLIAAFLEENQIDLDADQKAGIRASAQEKLRTQQEVISQTALKSRDNNFTAVFNLIRPAAQVLKKFYSSNTATLKDWGIPIADGERITYPSSFEDRNTMATNFFTKLASLDAGKNPLAAYIKTNGVDVASLTKKNTEAATNNITAKAAAKTAENATQVRDLLWKNPLSDIRSIGKYLKSIYASNPRALGDWGFVVDESDNKPVLRKSKLQLGETKTFLGIKVGSVLTNTGDVNIVLYKGNAITTEGSNIKPGDKMGMMKGFSIITVTNTSTLEVAEFTVDVNK